MTGIAGESQLPLVRDAATNQYINDVGRQIARGADPRGIQYTFYVVNSDVVNAFALPGGYVYTNRGLVERADNLAQLAGVLAHEIGHVVERHSTEAGGRTGYSPLAEREADHGALTYTIRAGFNPAGLPQFLAKLLAAQEQAPGKAQQWLATHPLTPERIRTLETAIASTPAAQNPRLVTDTPAFEGLRERLRTLAPIPQDR